MIFCLLLDLWCCDILLFWILLLIPNFDVDLDSQLVCCGFAQGFYQLLYSFGAHWHSHSHWLLRLETVFIVQACPVKLDSRLSILERSIKLASRKLFMAVTAAVFTYVRLWAGHCVGSVRRAAAQQSGRTGVQHSLSKFVRYLRYWC